jgi:SAM-dependent methyltransferase
VRRLFRATDRLYRTTTDVFDVVSCVGCGLIRLSPMPAPEEVGRYYPPRYWYSPDSGTADRLSEAYRRFVLRDHVRFVRRALEGVADGLVLDVGCGGGLFLRMLKERGVRGAGLDWSEEAARIAWRQNGVPTIRGSFPEAPLGDSSCAAITMFHVVEHLHDPVPYFRSAFRLLKTGGRLIVQVPNAASWQFRIFRARWNGLDVPRHLFDYSAADVQAMLETCGFMTLNKKYFSLRDNPAGMATSIVPSLDPMARRLRGLSESGAGKLIKDAVYFGIVVAALPFTLVEAAFRSGSTIMLEAKKP